MIRTIKERPLPGVPTLEPQDYEAPHAALSRRAAAEGMVLLKNEGKLLPLPTGTQLALYGAGAVKTVKGGTGSGDMNERYSVSIWEGLKHAGYPITSEAWLRDYEAVYDQARQEWKGEVLRREKDFPGFFAAYSSIPFRIPSGPAVTGSGAQTAVYVLGRIAGENKDRVAEQGDYYLSDEEHRMLADICHQYKHVIVILNVGCVVDLSFLDEFQNIQAVLLAGQPGMEGGNAVADVLSGNVAPSGKLTDTWAFRYEDYPNSATFSHNNGDVFRELYSEGLYVGYRYFDSFEIPARYGFGFGLSYTDFSVETVKIRGDKAGTVTISLDVTNTGETHSGREVVQAYVSLPEGDLEKEYRRLCAFAKTGELAPGERQRLELVFSAWELASYDEKTAQWVLEPGVYGVFVGASLAESVLIGSLELGEKKVLAQAKNICPIQAELTELSVPAERRRSRYDALVRACKEVPALSYELADLSTVVYDYGAGDRPEDKASRIADSLTQEQLTALVVGDLAKNPDNAVGNSAISVPGAAGETSSCALEQGVANIVLADGPAGLRLNHFYCVREDRARLLPYQAVVEQGLFFDDHALEGEKYYQFCTALPVGTLLAQSWDPALLEEVGRMVRDEMERFGVTLWLAPGMNIHRNPLCGRNFEYYSEDPLLTGKMAAALTRGVQDQSGCGTTIKHFACNNQEDNRMHSDSILSERVLREIYLRGFGIAIREAHPLSLMTSYNLVNGIHAANNYDLCTNAARREFGFDGLIMTDWTTTEQGPDCTAAGCIRAGNDLIMPGQFSDHESIRHALEDGSLGISKLKVCAANIIRVILQSNCYE